MNYLSIYNRMPVFIQNFLCSVKGHLLNRERYGGDYNSIYESLLESDRWDAKQILRYKEAEIAKIISYAYEHTRFYRDFFDAAGVKPSDFKKLEDLKKFPILTKELVREHWEDMISNDFRKRDLILYHTSGSTGKALDFYWTKHSVRFYWAVVWRGRSRFGISRGDLHFNFTGKIVVPLTQSKPPFWRFNRPLNQYMINMQHITPEKVASIVDLLNRKKPKFFVGYPSIIHSFAMMIEENGLKVKAVPEYIFSSAEKMYDFQREVIERIFPGTKIVEHYGFSENAAAASKALDGYYHEDFELGHLELKDPIKTADGLTGKMLATGFQNLGMPFIRYEIGDTATFFESLIRNVEGRNEDYILTPEGTRIMRLDYIFKGIEGIKEAQIIQQSLDDIEIKVVATEHGDVLIIERQLIDNYHKLISLSQEVKVEFVNSISRTTSGKFKAVVQKMQITPPHTHILKSQIISDIEGRNGDFVLTPEGARIMRFGYIFKRTEYIKECQIRQDSLGEIIIVAVIRDNSLTKKFEEEITESVHTWISPSIRIKFEYKESIPRTSSGKFKAVISNL